MRCLLALLVLAGVASGQTLKVGSKKFTESVILGEIVRQLAENAGERVKTVHRRELGGTRILFEALRKGEIDVYPEYTGTLRLDILKNLKLKKDSELPAALAELGLRMSPTLGFANSYGVGARRDWAAKNKVTKISDLKRHPGMQLLCSNEFLGRGDGFPALQRYYDLSLEPRGLDHDLAYVAVSGGSSPLVVVYTTEPEIRYHELLVLEDDLRFFPAYDAVLLYRAAVADTPAMREVLRLCGRITNEEMIALNLQAKPPSGVGIERVPENVVAGRFLADEFGIESRETGIRWYERLLFRTMEQLLLVVVSMVFAILIAVPLGIQAAREPAFGQVVLAVTGVLQTVPSLALLVLLIPLLGIGAIPAIAALFVYSLLPIVRNTHSGLTTIPVELVESAQALGLPARARLHAVELPLAVPAILAGIKTAVVINIGTATLGAFIDAGGYGAPILTGIRLNDYGLVLQGAIPAALMAVLAQVLFDWIERRLVPRGLR